MLTSRYQPFFHRLLEGPARFLARWRVMPTTLTFLGLFLVGASCLVLIRTRQLLLFCGLVMGASLCDALDGAVARASGRVTKQGAYLDALCDRYAEAAVVLSVAFVTGYWALSSALLVGTMLVSYAKARAALEAPVSNLEWPDLMERTERGAVYLAGLAGSQVVGWRPLGHELFWWTLLVLSVLVHATVLQRVIRAVGFIRQRGGRKLN